MSHSPKYKSGTSVTYLSPHFRTYQEGVVELSYSHPTNKNTCYGVWNEDHYLHEVVTEDNIHGPVGS